LTSVPIMSSTSTLPTQSKHVQSVYYLQLKLCKDILDALCSHENAFLFLNPVDVIGLGLTDYHTIIKNPMDYSTIRVRLLFCGICFVQQNLFPV
jgi:hypothetical protein